MPARKSPAQITAQAAGDEASELGKQRSKSPGNQCTTTTVPIQSLNSTPAPPCLLLKPHKRCQLIDGRRYRDTARANTAGHQRNGSGNPWRSRPKGHPHPSRQRNSLHQSPKNPPRKPARRKQQKLSQNAGRRRPQVAPRPQDADVLAHAEPLLREGAPGRRAEEDLPNFYKVRAVGLPPARRAGEEEEGALEEAVSLFSTT